MFSYPDTEPAASSIMTPYTIPPLPVSWLPPTSHHPPLPFHPPSLTHDPRRKSESKYGCTRDPNCLSRFTQIHNRKLHERKCHPLDSDFTLCGGCDNKVYTDKLDEHKINCAKIGIVVKRLRPSSPIPTLPTPLPSTTISDDVIMKKIEPYIHFLTVVSKDSWTNEIKDGIITCPKKLQKQRSLLSTIIRSAYAAKPHHFADGFTLRALVHGFRVWV